MIINKSDYPDVFFHNYEMPEEDIALFDHVLPSNITGKEREFFEKMHEKETGEFACEADLLLSEYHNEDEIYIVRYYFTEYRVGRGTYDNRPVSATYTINLAEALEADLFKFLGQHITLIEWLREHDFKGINYFGNYQLNR